MLVSIKKQRQGFWVDEEVQPEEETAIALDFVGSDYEKNELCWPHSVAYEETACKEIGKDIANEKVVGKKVASGVVTGKAGGETEGTAEKLLCGEGIGGDGVSDILRVKEGTPRCLEGEESRASRGDSLVCQEKPPLQLAVPTICGKSGWRWVGLAVLAHIVIVLLVFVVLRTATA